MRLSHLLVAAAAHIPTIHAATWSNVKIGGGGGFVPSIVFHPNASGVAYARTDIGGLYKLNKDDSWTALTDELATDSQWNFYGVDALALDPQDENAIFAAVGMYTNSWDPNNGSIIRSADQGATWETTTLPFKVGGNMPGRGMGERLAVDPSNSAIIYFGARSGNGLWKSTDAGASFEKVDSFTAVGTYAPDPTDVNGYNNDLQGLAFVTFDSTSALIDGATSRIFVGTADNITASVYVSEDAGATWSAVAGQPSTYFPHKGRLQAAEKALYLTYADASGPYDGTMGSVWRYDLTNSSWTDITPVSGSDLYFGFGGLGLDMLNPGTLIVATLNSWYPDAQIFRSTDSGATWSKLWEYTSYPDMNLYYSQNTDKAPWVETNFLADDTKKLGWMIESLEIDPHDSDHWLYGTGLTVFGGHDLTSWDTVHNVSIASLADGIEEYAVQNLASAPGGSELMAAIADENGFTFASAADLQTAPKQIWSNPEWATSVDVDFAGASVLQVARIGNVAGTAQLALSSDGGVTWAPHSGASTTDQGGSVAVSADGATVLWSSATSGVLRSANQTTFAAVASVPSGALIASDKQDATVFYAAAGGNGSLLVSTDSGATFTAAAGSLGSATSVTDIAAHPTTAGEVYVSTDAGIFKSTDSGATFASFSADAGLTNTQHISLGLPAANATSWVVYAFGTGSAGNKLYASADAGATFVDIQGAKGFGSITATRVAGSANVAGQVYVGTNGRGIFVATAGL